MRNPIFPLQEATLAALTAEITKYPIYDKVPKDEPTNYITIGEFDFEDASTKTSEGMEVTHTPICWSKYQGTKEVADMLNEVIRVLSKFNPDLSADNFSCQRKGRFVRGKIARYEHREGAIYRYGSVSFLYDIEDKEVQ